ncbi:hypothetical protein HDU97_006292 [Phlyctochytrium planicorne]|nr:hypothetical protein HDU97_006292 [Phlyctochytrium planicorne]
MQLFKSSALLAILASVATAQQLCERVIDNMKVPNTRYSDNYKDIRNINLLGGDYGVDGGSKLTIAPGAVTVVPGDSVDKIKQEDTDPTVHPVEPAVGNYFFFKFGWDDFFNVCYDLSPFDYLYINMSMPAGADGYVTLTTKVSACNARTKDSTYQKLSKYVAADGQPHLARIDLKKDFAQNYDNTKENDFVHNKDITFVALTPQASFNFFYLSLVGPCDKVGTVNSTQIAALPGSTGAATSSQAPSTASVSGVTSGAPAASTGASTPAATSKPSSAQPNSQSGFLAVVGAVIGALALF